MVEVLWRAGDPDDGLAATIRDSGQVALVTSSSTLVLIDVEHGRHIRIPGPGASPLPGDRQWQVTLEMDVTARGALLTALGTWFATTPLRAVIAGPFPGIDGAEPRLLRQITDVLGPDTTDPSQGDAP